MGSKMKELNEGFRQCVVEGLSKKNFLSTLEDSGVIIILEVVGSSFEVYVEQYQEEIYSRNFISLDSYNKTSEKGISPYSKLADALVKACVYWETAMDALGNELPSDYTVVAAPDGISLKLARFS